MPLRILIVEDEPLIAMDLHDIMERGGHEVVGTAVDMEGALAVAEANPHLDLAIMDVVLARAPNGVTAARRLRQDFDVASLFVSANIDDRLIAMASEWGPIGFIGKPYQEERILDAIAALADRATPH